MSRVSEYVDNMFFALPQTEETSNMRWQITESMEDRYAALVAEGYSEDAALGAVVSEFGSMEEICQSLGYQAGSGPDPYLQVEYEEFRSKYAIGLGAGVAGTILAAGLSMPISELLSDAFAMAFFFIVMAASVFDIVYWCVQEDKYKELKKQLKRQQKNAGFTAPNPAFSRTTGQKRTSKQMIRQITHTLCALIMPVFTLLFFLLGVFFNAWHPAWILFPAGGLLCGIVGIVGTALEKMLDN